MKILIVDDHLMIRDGIKFLLDDFKIDCETFEASDGLQATKMAAKTDFDIIFMDISMPILDGISATKKIMTNNANNKVIAISMHTDETDIMRMEKVGAKGYLLKDTIADTLKTAIEKTLAGDDFFMLR